MAKFMGDPHGGFFSKKVHLVHPGQERKYVICAKRNFDVNVLCVRSSPRKYVPTSQQGAWVSFEQCEPTAGTQERR